MHHTKLRIFTYRHIKIRVSAFYESTIVLILFIYLQSFYVYLTFTVITSTLVVIAQLFIHMHKVRHL